MVNRRWKMDDLNRMTTIEFAEAILYERESNLTNGYAPLTVKLEQTRAGLEEIKTKLELIGNEGFVVMNGDRPVRIFVNVLDFLKYIDQSYLGEFGEKYKTSFIKPVMPENSFIKEMVREDQFRLNGELYTRVIINTSYDDPDALPIYVRDRTLRREVYQVFTEKDKTSGGYKAESKLTFKTWGEAEYYIKAEKQRIANSIGFK